MLSFECLALCSTDFGCEIGSELKTADNSKYIQAGSLLEGVVHQMQAKRGVLLFILPQECRNQSPSPN